MQLKQSVLQYYNFTPLHIADSHPQIF